MLKARKVNKLLILFVIKHYLCAAMKAYEKLIEKALTEGYLNLDEGLSLYLDTPLPELMAAAHILRQKAVEGNMVGWIIDRNVNITNVCFSQCKFCNFCRKANDAEAYITSPEEYTIKIRELFERGGNQLLLQGGMNPGLGLEYYEDLFSELKRKFPSLKLHALGPPEVVYLAQKSSLSYRDVLIRLVNSGLDSLPGAGAEILADRVRKIVSPAKATTEQWLNVMREAHRLNLPTSATMMFGHVETPVERIEHLIRLREVQEEKPEGSYGFVTFVPWPFQDEGTVLALKHNIRSRVTIIDYVRLVAVSRIMLTNITNIQSSILTVGKDAAMMTLHGGANDLGSVMIEENVVSAAGSNGMLNAEQLQMVIRDAGFVPQQRNQKYEAVNKLET